LYTQAALCDWRKHGDCPVIDDRDATFFPVLHSVLSPDALMSVVLPTYDVGTPTLCAPFPPGINDSYLVRTDEGIAYVLRVYRAGWRSATDVRCELDLLRHLDAEGVSVSAPVPRRDGTFIHTLHAPEGVRIAALFTFAPGEPLDRESGTHAAAHGCALAHIHAATDDFGGLFDRAPLDLKVLINWSLAQMEPYFARRPEDWAYMRDVAIRLTAQAATLNVTDWGVCHGDPYSGNAHITGDGEITFFDFDCCGMGWRAYDLAGVRWFLEHSRQAEGDALWQTFLAGYRTLRPVADADIAAIPYFVAVRTLWHNALGARAESLGIQRYDDFCKRGLAMLRAREDASSLG
jgi:Ser/Thr protein kinase RdoA (MazF antagonist)